MILECVSLTILMSTNVNFYKLVYIKLSFEFKWVIRVNDEICLIN